MIGNSISTWYSQHDNLFNPFYSSRYRKPIVLVLHVQYCFFFCPFLSLDLVQRFYLFYQLTLVQLRPTVEAIGVNLIKEHAILLTNKYKLIKHLIAIYFARIYIIVAVVFKKCNKVTNFYFFIFFRFICIYASNHVT